MKINSCAAMLNVTKITATPMNSNKFTGPWQRGRPTHTNNNIISAHVLIW